MAKRNPRAGSSFDDFLKADGIYEDVQNAAIKKVLSAKLEAAMEAATKDAEFGDLLANKLKFPVKFVGSDALTKDINMTVQGLKTVIEKTRK